ncbi:CBS domain-containing protein [Actinoplanes sp. NPDC026623]|uniref:CBS domain-containing protein n=1 Tax=Actinoplanes sp. NPDC026623 TaxID=3155610 RepID=UPI0033F796F5
MTTWRVQDVMTTEVITAPVDASVAEIVALLTERRITAVPVVDRFDVVLGVVSWTDLRRKITVAAPDAGSSVGRWRQRVQPSVQWPQGIAAEVMSAPALTIGADASLPAAARVMHRRGVGRLLVVDRDRRLRGIVTRSDLLKVHARLDAVIREDVLRQVVGRTPQIAPGTIQVGVDDGMVTLTGHTDRKTTAVAVARLTATVPGVTDVVDLLRFDVDDTITATPRAPGPRPFRGLRTARPPAQRVHSQPADRPPVTTGA